MSHLSPNPQSTGGLLYAASSSSTGPANEQSYSFSSVYELRSAGSSPSGSPVSTRPSTPLLGSHALVRRASSTNLDMAPPPDPAPSYPQGSIQNTMTIEEPKAQPQLRWTGPTSPKAVGVAFARAASRPATYLSLAQRFAWFVISLDISLSAFFLFSVTQTITNKFLLRGYFPFVWLLTTLQLACCTAGVALAARLGAYVPARVSPARTLHLRLISLLFSAELLANNLALRVVTVPYFTSVRATAPLLTLLLNILAFNSTTSLRTASTLLVILLGISFTSHSDPWTSLGSLITCTSVVLTSAKSLVTTRLLLAGEGYNLHPLEVLGRMSRWGMAHCLLFALVNGEVGRFVGFLRGEDCTWGHLGWVALNGSVSFLVPLVGIHAERRTRPPAKDITSEDRTTAW